MCSQIRKAFVFDSASNKYQYNKYHSATISQHQKMSSWDLFATFCTTEIVVVQNDESVFKVIVFLLFILCIFVQSTGTLCDFCC